MRKILLATSLISGAILFSNAAQAGMEVTIGGYDDFRAGFFRDPLTTSPRRSMDFQNEFQLEVEAKAKAQNGMEYGVVASLWNGYDYTNYPSTLPGSHDAVPTGNTGMRIHQAYGYVNGVWGQVRLGDEHGASDFGVSAPQTYDFGGQVNGYYDHFLTPGTVWAVKPAFIDDQENNTKISYFTPKFGYQGHKFQAGISYAPNAYDQGTSAIIAENPAFMGPLGGDNYKDVFELGAGYEGAWWNNQITTKAGFVGTTGTGVNGATFGMGQPVHSYTTWDLGAQVGYKGFAVGGNYTDGGRYNTAIQQDNSQYVWDVGVSYKFDRASLAASYLSGRGYNDMMGGGGSMSGGASNEVTDYHAWGVGAGYSLFDGMVTSVDAVFFHQEATEAGTIGDMNTNGHVVILSNRISF